MERKLAEEASKQKKEKIEMEMKLIEDKERLEQKLIEENQQKQEKEKLLQERIQKNEDEKNEILQLYDKMRRENEARKKENEDLRELLDREKESLFMSFSRGNSEVRDLLEREKEELKRRIDSQREASAVLEQELVRRSEDDLKEREAREEVKSIVTSLESLVSRQLSVYFTAVREEPYLTGGEEYLTFSHCTVNGGGAMNPTSGIFSAPYTGCYMFSIHVCTHDMKKALAALRRNGVEVATLFDQNHVDNHKNSMASQSIILELQEGDRVQVYLYTFTGLHDKPGNHLTQFMGFLLRCPPSTRAGPMVTVSMEMEEGEGKGSSWRMISQGRRLLSYQTIPPDWRRFC